MLFIEDTRLFRTRHWTELWHGNLPDLQSTKGVAANTIFVAIDTEPWWDESGKRLDDRETCEIGLAFLFPETNSGQLRSEPPRTFQQTCKMFSVSSHCIRIRDRKQFLGERFWKGGEEVVPSFDPDQVGDALVNLVQTTKQQFPCSGEPPMLTLVGFDLSAEFRIFAHNYPRFLRCFSAWVDVQDLARDLAHMSQAPSLQNTLVAFGFEGCPALAPNSKRHNAGNDAMRTICALVVLLFYQPLGEHLAHVCREYHLRRAKQRRLEQRTRMDMKRSDLFRKRYPSPREKYPFAAKVDLPHATLTAPPDAEAVCEYFVGFEPVAAGGNCTHVFGGWICLASLRELEAFVEAGRWAGRCRGPREMECALRI